MVTFICPPFTKSPNKILSAKGFFIFSCITLAKGLAPYTGSKPFSANKGFLLLYLIL